MSKVFRFRLDENNPREAQAMRVIDAWIEEGYSLRQLLVDVLVTYKNESGHKPDTEALLEKIMSLLVTISDGKKSILNGNVRDDKLSQKFVGAISKSAKDGMKIVIDK